MSNQKSNLIALIAAWFILSGIIMWVTDFVFPNGDLFVKLSLPPLLAMLICAFAVKIAGQSGGLTAQDFFVESVAANSRAVIIVCSPEDLWETVHRFHAKGLAPVVAAA